jgi:hypothetical protein
MSFLNRVRPSRTPPKYCHYCRNEADLIGRHEAEEVRVELTEDAFGALHRI